MKTNSAAVGGVSQRRGLRRMRDRWDMWCALLALCAGPACPERVSGDGAPAHPPCAEVGQRCEVSPGKLGSCVVIDNCKQSNCYVCQSQH